MVSSILLSVKSSLEEIANLLYFCFTVDQKKSFSSQAKRMRISFVLFLCKEDRTKSLMSFKNNAQFVFWEFSEFFSLTKLKDKLQSDFLSLKPCSHWNWFPRPSLNWNNICFSYNNSTPHPFSVNSVNVWTLPRSFHTNKSKHHF